MAGMNRDPGARIRQRPTKLREACQCLIDKNRPGTSSPVDRAAGTIRGVKILSRESRNGRVYTPECLQRAARLYEGVSVRVDHPDRNDDSDRKAGDVLGRLKNVKVAHDGLYGDLEYLRSHPLTPRLIEAAERMPDAYGLSHNVEDWDGHYEGGTYVVTEIRKVESVDLVADPATTRGLFESRRPRRRRKLMKLREWAQKQAKPVRDTFVRLMETGSCAGSLNMTEDDDPESNVKAAFDAAVMAIVQDDKADLKTQMKKLRDVLKSKESLLSSGALTPTTLDDEGMGDMEEDTYGEDVAGDELADGDDLEESDDASDLEPEDDEEDEEAGMSEALRRENEQLKAELEVRRLCESQRVQPTPALLKALVRLDDEDDRRALLREHRTRRKTTASGDAADEVTDGASFARAITD